MQAAPLDEDLGQPFRLANHQAVTGVDFDQRLHSAERLNVLALQLRRDGAIP
jgi:hypothetical protein